MNRYVVMASVLGILAVSVMAEAQPPSSCALPHPSGVQEQRLSSGGLDRSYRLFVPPGYDGRTRLPVVLDLHGSGGTAAGQANTSQFEALVAGEGFLVASLQADGSRWNVPVTEGRPDDVAYVSDVIDQMAGRVCTDLARVYATGFTGGGRMSSLLGCRLNARIAAIAPMAGLRWPGFSEESLTCEEAGQLDECHLDDLLKRLIRDAHHEAANRADGGSRVGSAGSPLGACE